MPAPESISPIRGNGPWPAALASAGLTPQSIFTDPRIRPWRRLDGRDNAVLDLPGLPKLHVKRFDRGDEAAAEVEAINRLRAARIPTLDLAACGWLPDGRGFIMTEDLAGHVSAQELLRRGRPFAAIAGPTSALAAHLHQAGLHHRDLYLCHLFLREGDGDCRLIDVGRARKLPRLLARRWVIKDLGQFAYSTREFHVPGPELAAWFTAYAGGNSKIGAMWHSAAERKTRAIARHDARLRRRDPDRNISIPPELGLAEIRPAQ